ncbi:MAG: hypothetical protein JO200_08420 [Comamonas sp.]|nr:hypothetical protein [Comamonas sp.]
MSGQIIKCTLSTLAFAALVACGGGGGSGNSAGNGNETSKSVQVNGVAAKGLLANAKVELFELGANGPASKALAEGTTDANGKFSLSVPATKSSFLVVVTAIAGTTMLDETQVENGKYKAIAVTPGMTLRSFVKDASSGTVTASVNPFTDAAVTAAESWAQNNGNQWTSASINAAMDLAKALVNNKANPFEAQPTNLDGAQTAAVDSTHLMVALSGFMQAAQSCSASNGATGIDCQLQSLRTLAASAIKLTPQGTATIKNGEALANYIVAQYTAAAELNSKQESPLQSLAQPVDKQAILDLISNINATPSGSGDFVAFLDNLREAFLSVEKTIRGAEDTLNQRYAYFSNEAYGSILDGISYLNDSCVVSAAGFRCATYSGWIPQADGSVKYSTRWTGPEGVQIISASAKVNYANGSGTTVSYKGFIKINDATTSETDLSLGVNGIAPPTSANGDWVQISDAVSTKLSGTFSKYSAGEKATLEFQDLAVSASRIDKTEDPRTWALSGGVKISSTYGDAFTGNLRVNGKTKMLPNTQRNVATIDSLNAQLTAVVTNSTSNTADLSLKGSYLPTVYTNAGFDAYNLDSSLKINGGDVVGLSISRIAAGAVNAQVNAGAGSNAVNFSATANKATGAYCFNADALHRLCADTIQIKSADSRYTASVNAATKRGDILHNGEKVGEITGSGVQVNGKEYSFY